MNDETSFLVNDYLVKSSLSKIGYQFNSDELTDFEVEYLTEVHHVFNQLDEEEMKKASRKK